MGNYDNIKEKEYEVLIVDDDAKNIQVLSNILNNRGLEVSFATSGLQTLEFVKEFLPDLILLDIGIPDMNGYEICQHLKADSRTQHIPIIFLTARTEISDIIKGFELGAVDYVTKPFNSLELISRVFTHLELKRSRDVIRTQNENLKELNSIKDKFFSIVAHDLKNPFNVLIGFSDLLLKRYLVFDDKKRLEIIDTINKSANAGFALLENLLEWSRSQTGRMNLEAQLFDINTSIDICWDLLIPMADNKEIQLERITFPETLVYADANMIKTVLRNLITNALKYTNKGGKVSIRTEINEEYVLTSIEDTGIGIQKDVLETIFRLDCAISKEGTAEERGTGLGLILCKEFVEKNGGYIGVDSQVGKGSRFYFSLPRQKLVEC